MNQITPLPTPPNRSKPSTFSARADDFLGALPTFVSETNVVANDVLSTSEEASASAVQAGLEADRARDYRDVTLEYRDAAFAANNFKGVWSELTGSLIIPSSVLHNSRLWMLTENVADVTSVEPGVSSLWFDVTFPKVAFAGLWSNLSGGVTTPSLVLHNSLLWFLLDDLLDITQHEPGVSNSWIEAQGRLGGKSVYYSADATLDLTTGQRISTASGGIVLTFPLFTVADEGRTVTIYNDGEFSFHIYTVSGVRITLLLPGFALKIRLVDSMTQKFALSYVDLSHQSTLYLQRGTANSLGNDSYDVTTIQVSDDRALILAGVRGYLVETTPGEFVDTKGYVSNFGIYNNSDYNVTLLEEHKVLYVAADNYIDKTRAFVLSTDGDTIVDHTNLILSDYGLIPKTTTLSTDKALVCYRVSDYELRVRVISVSGTTLTEGAAFTITTSDSNPVPISILALSSSVALLAYYPGTTGEVKLQLLSVSGTTVSSLSGSITETLYGPDSYLSRGSMILLDTDKVFLSLTSSVGHMVACVVIVSGPSIILGDVWSPISTYGGGDCFSVKLSSNRVIFGRTTLFIADIDGVNISVTLPGGQITTGYTYGLLAVGSDDEIIELKGQHSALGLYVRKIFLGMI
jgi:hypothetical protein